MRMTSKPCEVIPSENAVAKSGDDGRISSPTTTVAGSRSRSTNFAKAMPNEKAKSGVISSSTKPRMS